ncbi:hypothetical protein ALT_4528 [Aspergillus lentulus]|uniref:SP-RING-type domain-containing protein n=1 Tax=Aspergillus lentulus TaxID=293939 RepID=A0AAN4TAV7_ASPLE|nr:hypothetical protein ALT_4528 [Aspergillus lentulus]
MSPSTKNRPHLPNNPHHQLEWSNSTANLFLGGVGVRRSWMLDASSSLSINSAPAPAPAPAPAAVQSSLAVVSAPSSASASAVANRPKSRPQGMQNSPSSSIRIVPQSQSKRDNNDVAFTANGNIIHPPATSPPSVLMSPVTPGGILPQNREIPPPGPGVPPSARVFTTTPTTNFSATPLTSESTAFVHATQPLQQSHSSSLPSPDPSSASHPSPASAGDRNDRSLSHGVLPSPPPVSGPMQIHGQLENPRRIGYRNLMPASASPTTAGVERMAEETSAPATIRGRQRHQATASPQQFIAPAPPEVQQQSRPSMTSAAPDSNHVPPSPVGPGPSTSFINQTFWTQSQEALDAFVARADGAMLLSETVELPRTRLLRDACLEKDLFYLTLHQIYTLRTFAPSEFARLPYVSGQNETGMEVVQQLLVDNHRLSGDFLRWSVNFPRPLGVMCQTREFPIVLHQIARSLGFFSEKWTAFDRHVRERGYPPLIDELVVQFGITSSVLLSIVFLALSRRIFGTQHEDQLRSIYSKNKRNYVKRFGSRLTPQQLHRENERLIQAYKALSGTQTSPVGQHTSSVARDHAAQPLSQRSMQTVGPAGQITYVAVPSPQMPSAQVPVHCSQPQTQPVPAHAPGAMNRAASMLLNGQSPQHPLPTRPNLVHARGLDTSSQVPAGQMTGTATHSPVPAPAPAPAGYQAQILSHPPSQNGRRIPPQPSPQAMPSTTPIHRFTTKTRHVQGLVQQPQQSPPVPQPLLPPPGSLPSTMTRPHPLRQALHQAHLRDPIIKWNSSGAGGEKTDKETNLFHYLNSFAVPPTPLGLAESAFEWQFPLSRADFDRLPRIVPRDTGQRLVRSLVDGSQIYRLRCIRISPSANEVSQHTWCLTESVWPSVIYVFVNGVELYVRRKFHNGKDIPLDISGHLKEGLNTITLHFIRSAAENRDVVYALAVEVMDILSFTQVKKLAQTLPALQSRERIRRRLSSSTADDELSIVSDYLTVNLVDPFMARIFNIPARGITCEHVECFDLETYILTRASKAGKAALKENWKCPICGADARPQHLIIDDFLTEVRADLVRTGCLEGARAIKIKADGSWELKSDGEGTSSEKELARAQEGSSLKRKREGVVSPVATQRLKTEDAGRESLASRESSASLVIELD